MYLFLFSYGLTNYGDIPHMNELMNEMYFCIFDFFFSINCLVSVKQLNFQILG